MSTIALARPAPKILLLDAMLCAFVAALPALSHAAALPLYRFEPLRLLIFAAILFSSRRNALLMAFWLPLLSTLTSGHPVFPKVCLIQGELMLNVLLFFGLYHRSNRFAVSATVAVLASKVVYYAAKYLLIRAALIDGSLMATDWTYQIVVLMIILVGGGAILAAGQAREGRH